MESRKESGFTITYYIFGILGLYIVFSLYTGAVDGQRERMEQVQKAANYLATEKIKELKSVDYYDLERFENEKESFLKAPELSSKITFDRKTIITYREDDSVVGTVIVSSNSVDYSIKAERKYKLFD